MKKPVFIIAETLLSLVLAASLAAVAALAIDIKTNGKLIPPELYGGKSESSAASEQSKTENSKSESSQQASEASAKESSEKEQQSSKEEEPSKETSKDNKTKSTEGLILKAPDGLNSQPKDLSEFINNSGFSFESLGFDHLIVVDTNTDSTAKIYCYQKNDNGYWWNIVGEEKPMTDKGFIGEEGTGYDLEPDSRRTPLGFYTLGKGFYIGDKPQSTYPMFEITDKTYWVDDPHSAFYNTMVEGTDKKDWSSADHMISAKDAYKYGIVIEYNTYNIDTGLANSIFINCGDSPSEGSVVVPQATMKTILEWLDEDSNPYVYIV